MEKNKEIAIKIIDKFEELLARYDIKIPSNDRQKNEDESCIFGKEYYDLESSIINILNKR